MDHDDALDLYAHYLGLKLTIMTVSRLPIGFVTHPGQALYFRENHLARLHTDLAAAEEALIAAGLGSRTSVRGSAAEVSPEWGVEGDD